MRQLRHVTLLLMATLIAGSAATCNLAAAHADEVFGRPTGLSRNVARMVDQLLKQHLSNRQLNDEISRRALDAYLKALDPMKLYFKQTDIEEFNQYADKLDDLLPQGDYTVAFLVFKRYLERLEQHVQIAHEMIDKEHDFTVDEELVTDRDKIEYARDEAELRDRWRKRIKYELLMRKSDKDQSVDPLERLHRRYRTLVNRSKQFTNEDVIEMYITAITTSFDPHTAYMSRSTYESFMINMRLELDGIGATLQPADDGYTVIRRIVPGGAADKHGKLRVDDKIVYVGQGEDGEMVDVTDMKLDAVVDMIRGPAGTVVRLGVLTPTANELQYYNITRERIELTDSEARGKIFEEGYRPDGSPMKIGVIDLPSFYSDMESDNVRSAFAKSSTRDVRRLLEEFKRQGVDAVVLDLRRNGGGSLREAIDCTGLFIDSGPVVQVKDSLNRIEVHNDRSRGMAWDGPLVVVTSKFSASASEILAGAIQDYQRGIVVGDTSTHGKGTVQTLVNLSGSLLRVPNPPNTLGALKITIQQFYRPNGDSTQQRGVLADIVLPALSDNMDISEGDMDYALEFDRIPAARFTPLNLVNRSMLSELRKRSEQRVAEDEDFQKELQRIEYYIEQKQRKSVSLNEERFFERRRNLDADREDEEAINRQLNPSPEIERDFYMDEVLRIASEYATLLSGRSVAQR